MATYGKKLIDGEGNIILPKTRSSLVYMDDNETLENTIKKILSGETTVGKAIDCSSAGNLRMYNTETDETSYVGLSSADSAGNLGFFWDSTNSKTVLVQGYDNTARTTANAAMPKSGGTFTGRVTFNGGASIAQDKSAGSGVFVQPIHIPNISQNVRFIILWT